jgi:Integrase core domain
VRGADHPITELACGAAPVGAPAHCGARPLSAPRLRAAGRRPEDGAPAGAAWRRGGTGAAACHRRRAAPLRLPAARHPARARGHAHESQEAVSAVPRAGAGGAPPAWPQARVPVSAGCSTWSQTASPPRSGSPASAWRAVADTSVSGRWVARELDRLLAVRGSPITIVSDNGLELTLRAILAWTDRSHLIGRLRDELLNEEIFDNLAQARRLLERWRLDYNQIRPTPPMAACRRPRLGNSSLRTHT